MLERCPESVLAMSPEGWLEDAAGTGEWDKEAEAT